MDTYALTREAPFIAAFEVAVAVVMFAWSLPRQRHERLRIAVCVLAIVGLVALVSWLGFVRFPRLTGRFTFQSLIAAYSLTLVVAVIGIMWCFDTSIWTALFCATAGYVTQNAASAATELLSVVAQSVLHRPLANSEQILLTAVVFAATYLLVHRMVVRPLKTNGLAIAENRLMLFVLVLVFLVNIVFGMVNRTLTVYGVPPVIVALLHIIHLVLCAFILVVEVELLHAKRLQAEVTTMQQIREEEQRQLRLSRENIDAVNARVAEIRTQIARLEDSDLAVDKDVLSALEKNVGVYDSVVKTGNHTLDLILAEKSLTCEKNGITLTCIADGGALSFVEANDLYSLLGNALENAIDAVKACAVPEKRAIGLTVRRIGGGDAVVINVDNYYTGQINFVGGVPQTTKGSSLVHGYGMRAMKECVERYGGTLRASTDEDIFHLNVILSPADSEHARINPLAAAATSSTVSGSGSSSLSTPRTSSELESTSGSRTGEAS